MKTCPDCAERIQDAALKCRFCGHEFTHDEADAARERSLKQTGLVVAGLLAAGALSTVLFPSGGQPPQPVAAKTTELNPAHGMLLRMSENERRAALAQWMRNSGERCARITRTFYQGMTDTHHAFWNLRCSNSGDWSVMIEPDAVGSNRVLECDLYRALGISSECWVSFDDQRERT